MRGEEGGGEEQNKQNNKAQLLPNSLTAELKTQPPATQCETEEIINNVTLFYLLLCQTSASRAIRCTGKVPSSIMSVVHNLFDKADWTAGPGRGVFWLQRGGNGIVIEAGLF